MIDFSINLLPESLLSENFDHLKISDGKTYFPVAHRLRFCNFWAVRRSRKNTAQALITCLTCLLAINFLAQILSIRPKNLIRANSPQLSSSVVWQKSIPKKVKTDISLKNCVSYRWQPKSNVDLYHFHVLPIQHANSCRKSFPTLQ